MLKGAFCGLLCMVLAGCYFLEGGGVPYETVERTLLEDSNCLQRACWETWIPGETNIRELESSGRFNSSERDLDRSFIWLNGINEDSDIRAYVDVQSQKLIMLYFRGPYALDLQTVSNVLGPPEFFEMDRVHSMTIDPVLVSVNLYYPTRGYSFEFIWEIPDNNRQERAIQICFTNEGRLFEMWMYDAETIDGMFENLYTTERERDRETFIGRLQQWTGAECLIFNKW